VTTTAFGSWAPTEAIGKAKIAKMNVTRIGTS
jgi:hypothetical protein